jgi:hypothetical protein
LWRGCLFFRCLGSHRYCGNYLSFETGNADFNRRILPEGEPPINIQERETLTQVARQLEEALTSFEAILETTDITALYPASRSILAALRDLYEGDPALLTPEGRVRVEAQIEGEKKRKGGRDPFNTGF